MNGAEVSHLFRETGLTDFLAKNFETLHSQSPNGFWKKSMNTFQPSINKA